MNADKIVATLTIEVTFNEMPDVQNLQETVERLNGVGVITRAVLSIKKDIEISLLDS